MNYFALPENCTNPQAPMNESDFFKWMGAVKYEGGLARHVNVMDTIVAWLNSIGFDEETHRVDPEHLETLRTIHQHWWDVTPCFGPHHPEQLFTPTGYFTLRTEDGTKKVGITPTLREMLTVAGWVERPITPDKTFFELENKRLRSLYQTLLGSRLLCEVDP